MKPYTIRCRIVIIVILVVLAGQGLSAKKPPLFDKDYKFAGWSCLLGAVPYVGNSLLITGSVYSGVKLAKQESPWTHKAAVYPFLVGVAALNGYAMYLCYDNSDNMVPGIVTGSLGSGATIALGTLTAKYMQGKLSVDRGSDHRLAIYPAFTKAATGLSVSYCF